MYKRIFIIELVLICIVLFGGCFASAPKIEETNPVESIAAEDASSSEVNINKSKSINVIFEEIGFDLQGQELLFVLNNSLIDVDVIKLLGEPEKKSTPVIWGEEDALEYQRRLYNSKGSYQEIWGPDKVEYQDWYYSNKGIELKFIRNDENQQIVYSIDLQRKCTLKTSRGIGIGSTRSAVLKAYEHEINPEANMINSKSIVVGSADQGLIFTIEHDKVSSIFIGVTPLRDINR